MSFLTHTVENDLITQSKADEIKQKAQDQNRHVDELLEEAGVSEDDLLQAKGDYFNLPTRSVNPGDIEKSALQYISEDSASHYQIAPLGVRDNVLEVGAVNPQSIEVRDALNFISSKVKLPYKLFAITKQDFDGIIEKYGGLSSEVGEALSEMEGEVPSTAREPKEEPEEEPEERPSTDKTEELAEGGEVSESDTVSEGTIIEEAPVTKIVATILRYATEGGASDVHIEKTKENVRIRFRVDGVLNTSLLLPTKVHAPVVARIKILANMRLDEKRKPQDGRFSAKIEGRQIDFRVSTFPAYYGEKVVMRLLDQERGLMELSELGIAQRHQDLIEEALVASYGMILISGPTGSGKTTTLYSMLDRIDTERKNVLSLEDPVEYNVEGVNQSQVRPEIDYTFANGLRSALRQDPDVILVGEIRDKETADLAIHAALTGHLVLSTIHTNNAVGIIPRLIDMGIDPYLIGPTLILGMAQRLVSQLCEEAGEPKQVEGSIREMLNDQFSDLPGEYYSQYMPDSINVHEAGSTAECPTGTKGRTAVMEIVKMSDELEEVILSDPSEQNLYKVAREQGMLTMKEDAIIKSLEAKVPFQEVNTL